VTHATADGEGWRIDGVKLCVPAAAAATVVVTPARLDSGGVGIFLVDPKAPGVTLQPIETTNREVQYLMTLEGVRVPRDGVLGDPSSGAEMLDWWAQRATLALCCIQLGVTEKALRMTAEYTSTREQFERPLAAFQAVAQRAADAYIDVEGIRLTTMAAIWRLADALEAREEIAIAKYWAAEPAQRVVHTAQHLHGGVGVDVSYPLHRYFTWAKQIELTLGGATAQLLQLGKVLAGAAA
jgi:alkylation response protein AidB-like acyl-CoA dehydrogenase